MTSRRTPLFSNHKDLGAKIVDFAGWEMPIQYTSILSEHKSVREGAGIFDVSHMGQIFVKGPETIEFLSYVTTWDMRRQKKGDCRYCHILDENGGIIDDAIVYTISEDNYMLIPNASKISKVFDWLLKNSGDFEISLNNLSDEFFCFLPLCHIYERTTSGLNPIMNKTTVNFEYVGKKVIINKLIVLEKIKKIE